MNKRPRILKPAAQTPALLAVNGGSSSIRFAFYEAHAPMRRIMDGKMDRIGLPGTSLAFRDLLKGTSRRLRVAANSGKAVDFLLAWLEGQPVFASVAGVGHRIVHGMAHTKPARVTPRLLGELRRTAPFDPDHLPREIELIRAIQRRRPRLPQVACFDTAFHRTMPRVARILPIPRRFEAMGVVRYGFHGLSFEFLIGELRKTAGPGAARGRVILAHLGSGASMAAVRGGRSIDTSMGFTPVAGLVMGTRSGDLDPGIAGFLARREGMSPAGFQDMVNHESGLLGVSGTSSDMRDLLSREKRDARAAEAVELFCYQAKKWIGAYAAALGGLDTLVFAGGIGESSPGVRERICGGLGFLGVAIDARRNRANAPIISVRAAKVAVRVIRTDEELMIARSVARVLGLGKRQTKNL
jgi:acetate kinase